MELLHGIILRGLVNRKLVSTIPAEDLLTESVSFYHSSTIPNIIPGNIYVQTKKSNDDIL